MFCIFFHITSIIRISICLSSLYHSRFTIKSTTITTATTIERQCLTTTNFYLRLFKIFLCIHNFYLLHFAILRLATTLFRTFTIHKCSQSFVHFVAPPIEIHVSQRLQTFYSAGGFKPMKLDSRTS